MQASYAEFNFFLRMHLIFYNFSGKCLLAQAFAHPSDPHYNLLHG